MSVACFRQKAAQHVILPAAADIGSLGILSRTDELSKDASGLNRKLVCRYVFRWNPRPQAIRRFLQGRQPDSVRHGRYPEYQVQAYIAYAGFPEYPVCLPCRCRIMTPVHPFQDIVIKGLDTHAYAVHTGRGQRPDIRQPFLGNVFRIDFNGKLFIACSSAHGIQSLCDTVYTVRRQH